MEIISTDQLAFLPMNFIINYILLIHETLEWGEFTHQPLVFLKLDFSKAYDMVDLNFLFSAIEILGFREEFILMTRMLFKGAFVCVKINGAQMGSFKIECKIRQRCLLAPYIFLIVGEGMNAIIKTKVEAGTLRKILLL